VRKVLKMIVRLKKMGLVGGTGWGISLCKTRLLPFIVLGKPKMLEARTVYAYTWVA